MCVPLFCKYSCVKSKFTVSYERKNVMVPVSESWGLVIMSQIFISVSKEGRIKGYTLVCISNTGWPRKFSDKRNFEKKYDQDFVARFIINFLHIGFLPSFFLIYGILIQNLLGHQYSVHVHYKCVSVVFFRLHYVYTKKQRCVQIKATIYAYG